MSSLNGNSVKNTIKEMNMRNVLALLWSIFTFAMLSYILYKWGDQKEILTLIIGLVGGTILGSIFGYYFSATHKNKNETNDETPNTNGNN
jgi:Mn2+/Fe2+ NRAMP family transporter